MLRVSKRFYTINDLVEMGFASRVTVWRLIKDGKIPAMKVGRSVRIPVDGFESYCGSLLVSNGDGRS